MPVSDNNISALALAKAKIVAPLRGLRPIQSDKMIEACREAGELLGHKEGEVSHQTIRNWLEILETEGVAGLDRKPRKDRGKSDVSPKLLHVITGILLSPKCFSIAETHRRAKRYAVGFLKLPSEQIPSRKQIAYIWEHIPREDKVLGRKGIKKYCEQFDQHVRFEAPHANAIWQADHHQLDIIVIDERTGEELGRPWITKIQDDCSRAIMGYYLDLRYPDSISIALALYHAFLPKTQEWWIMHGLPNVLYVDNGQDWVSKHIEIVCLDFGIQLLRHEPEHPSSKGKIERKFRTLEEMCIHTIDGSVGSNLRTRPLKITPRHTLEQIRVKIERHIKEYHERKHGTTRQLPLDRWKNDASLVRTVQDLTMIDKLLKSKTYVVQRDGIHFQYGRYRDPDQILAGYIGQRVTAFYNPRDPSCIRLWGNDETGTFRFLCTAYPQEATEIPADRDAIMENNKRRQDLVRQRVRSSQQEGNQALKYLEADEAERDAEAQRSSAESADTLAIPAPAGGLLETRRSSVSSKRDSAAESNSTDTIASRRQLIRARRALQ